MADSGKIQAGKWIVLFLFLVLIIGFGVFVINKNLASRKLDLENSLAFLKSEYTFAQIGILSKNPGAIRFNLEFLDIDGSVVTDVNFELEGSDVFIESKVVMIDSEKTNKALVFPYNVYTDTLPPRLGKPLSALYTVNGFPEIYKADKTDASYENAVRYLYSRAFQETGTAGEENDAKIRIMDASIHQGQFRHFEEGQVYRCSVHPDGGLELTEVK